MISALEPLEAPKHQLQHANLQGQTRKVQDRGCKKTSNAQTFSMGKEEAIDE